MGADLLVSLVEVFGKTWMAQRRTTMLHLLKEMTKKQLEALDWRDFDTEVENADDHIEKNKRKAAKAAIEKFFKCLDNRDVVDLKLTHGRIILTGGESWGDSPTGAFNVIERFGCLPKELLKAGGFSE